MQMRMIINHINSIEKSHPTDPERQDKPTTLTAGCWCISEAEQGDTDQLIQACFMIERPSQT